MKYVEKSRRGAYLLAGFAGMFLCGVGDILLSYRGESGESTVGGMMTTGIADVPQGVYIASFFIGVIAAFGYWLGARAMYSQLCDTPSAAAHGRLMKLFSAGGTLFSMGLFGIHSVCCMALMALQSAARAGLSAAEIDKYFALPMLLPFTVTTLWQTLADIFAAIPFIVLVAKGEIKAPKASIVYGPICLFVIFNIIKAVLTAAGMGSAAHFFAGGETWGLSFMFLTMYFVGRKEDI